MNPDKSKFTGRNPERIKKVYKFLDIKVENQDTERNKNKMLESKLMKALLDKDDSERRKRCINKSFYGK
tara:strand:- start:56 stop:262 length:207 start_codon:yes stop_codon:yes gene_type:complete